MKSNVVYGFEGYYADRLLDFELPPISEEESRLICKKKERDGIPVQSAENTVLTVFKKDSFGKQTKRIDLSPACRTGSRVKLFVVLSAPPKLFAYTDEEKFGYFPLP